MKKLFSAIALVFVITTSYSQTCGNLTVMNNTTDNLVLEWVVGDPVTCNHSAHGTGVSVGPLSPAIIPAPSPGTDAWIGIIISSINGTPCHWQKPIPSCGPSFGPYTVNWNACTVTIN